MFVNREVKDYWSLIAGYWLRPVASYLLLDNTGCKLRVACCWLKKGELEIIGIGNLGLKKTPGFWD